MNTIADLSKIFQLTVNLIAIDQIPPTLYINNACHEMASSTSPED